MAGQAQWEVNLQVSNNLQELYALAEKLQGQLNSMENSKHEIKLNINEDELNKAMKNLNKMLDSIGKGTKNFTQFENLSKDIQEAVSSVKLLGSAFGKIDKDTGMSEMLTTIKNIDTALTSLSGKFENVKGLDIFNENQFGRIESIFSNIESHLSSIKGVLSDVGSGDELSPLLKSLENICQATSNIKLGLNLDLGSEVSERLNQKVSQSTTRQLQAYRNLYSAMRSTGHLNKEMMTFYEPEGASASELIGTYQGMIKRAEEQYKIGKSNKYKQTLGSTYDNLKKEIKNASAQLGRAETKRSENGILQDLFGNQTDLSGVISQLETICTKLDEISVSAKTFTDSFKEGLNVSTSIEEVNELTNRVKELETELASLKNNSSEVKGLENAARAVEKLESAKIIDIFPDDSDFESILKKLDLTKSKLSDIQKITMKTDIVKDDKGHEKPLTSYTLKDSRGSSEIYGESSHKQMGQMLRQKYVAYDSKEAEKEQKEQKRIMDEALAYQREQNKLDAQYRKERQRLLDQGKAQEKKENQKVVEDNIKYNKKYYDEEAKREEEYTKLKKKYSDQGKAQEKAYYNSVKKEQERTAKSDQDYALKTAREDIANYKKHAKELNRLKSAQVTSKDTKSYDEQIKIEEKELEAASTAMQKSIQRMSSFYNQNPLPIEQWREYNDVMKSHKQAVDEVVLSEAKLKDSIATSNSSVLSNMEESIKRDLSGIDKYQINASEHSTIYKDKIDEYSEAVYAKQAYKKQLEQKVKNGELINTEDIQNFEKYTNAVDKAKVAITSFKSAEKGASEWSRDKLRLKIAQTLNEYTGMSTDMKNELNILDQKLSTLGANANVSQLGSEFTNLQREIITTGQATQSFFDVVKEKAYYGIASGIGTYFGFDDFINQLKEGFNVIRELDSAFTEMKKVSDASDLSLKNYQKTTFDTADEVGTTAKTIQDSTATWMRLGESLDQASESAKTSNILFNVSEFEDIDSATESLVAVSQAYKDLDKMDIVNRLNQIGNDFSISTDGLATALQDSASSLLTSGNDIDEAISLITAGNAVTQDPAKVGAGMRTISLRLVGTEAAKKELSDLGEDTDDFITSQSKLRDVIMQATAAASKDGKGFDILDSNGNYKSTFEIMSGLEDLYDDIVAKDKELGTNNLNLLLETIAGEFLAWECRKYILRTYLIARATSIGQSYHVI